MTWLAKFFTGKDQTVRPMTEPRGRRNAREAHDAFVAHERAISENQRLRRLLEEETGHSRELGVTPWWERPNP